MVLVSRTISSVAAQGVKGHRHTREHLHHNICRWHRAVNLPQYSEVPPRKHIGRDKSEHLPNDQKSPPDHEPTPGRPMSFHIPILSISFDTAKHTQVLLQAGRIQCASRLI